ncbi:putative alpha-ketoglutarate-dependent sulfonate dioxygenase [Aspergillus ellipticus CBS 707.79]|uniref:Putative alpha-ketoglutarate-dependent sulfonate dioxygenase n=1 Tax=Aspergillus ellipticus CBS 707.79 TaxID=1448320 RepID=A0A319CWH6_9EURO|nr:putative alpha-ketoglutarate-dependent sulfonate dioxygenase [Aspergillus ellipticus CBS 707.79]
MAPSVAESSEIVVPIPAKTPLTREPLTPTGALSSYPSFDVTPIIGREFPTANLKEWLQAPNSDELLKELALTVSQRGVVFFRSQDTLTNDLQKELVQRLGSLSGKPSTSGLHVHPIINSNREEGVKDDEISVISSRTREKLFTAHEKKQSQRREWHSDITFEPVPSDYTILRLTELPETGGDTLWASGYELYDRISSLYQKFLEGLTATYAQPGFNDVAAKHGFPIFAGPRGAPENVGEELKAVHPVIRTNPVTGWKSVFAVGHHVQAINGLTEEESRALLDWFVKLIVENHDLQVRFRWQGANDLAIWDNRSVYHAATLDYTGLGARTGQRVVGLGEKPYLDEKSTGRREALARGQ